MGQLFLPAFGIEEQLQLGAMGCKGSKQAAPPSQQDSCLIDSKTVAMAPLLSRPSGEGWGIKAADAQGGAAAPPEPSPQQQGPQQQQRPRLQPDSHRQLGTALSIAPAPLQPAQALNAAPGHRRRQQQQRRRSGRRKAARPTTANTSPSEGGTASSCQGDAGLVATADLESLKNLFRFLRHSGAFQAASDEELWASLPHWACQRHAPGSAILEAGAALEAVHLVRHGKVQRVLPWATAEQQKAEESLTALIEAGKALASAAEPAGQLLRCSGGLGDENMPATDAGPSQQQHQPQAELAAGQGRATMQQEGAGEQPAPERSKTFTRQSAPGDDGAGSTAMIGRGECLALPELLSGTPALCHYVSQAGAVVMVLPLQLAKLLLGPART